MMTALHQSSTPYITGPLFKKWITRIGESVPVILGFSVLSSTSEKAKGILETRTEMLLARVCPSQVGKPIYKSKNRLTS
jgi:hypothetical protein